MPKRGIAFRSVTAAVDSGTRCSFPAFMRSAGIVHTRASISISIHVAPRTSPDRAAVKIANSAARAAIPSRWLNSFMKTPTSCHGKAGGFLTGAILLGLASRFSPSDLASVPGSHPAGACSTVAQSRMLSMRPRNLVTVPVLCCQIGLSTFTTKAVSTAATGSAPMIGPA